MKIITFPEEITKGEMDEIHLWASFLMMDIHHLAKLLGRFYFEFQVAFIRQVEKERGMTFNPAVWQLTLSRTLGDTTGK